MLYDEGPVGATGVTGVGAQEAGIPNCAIICADVIDPFAVTPSLLLNPAPVGAVPYPPEYAPLNPLHVT